jgi:hypothetical protein
MIYLKKFNESLNDLDNEIKEAVEECLLEYKTNYHMQISFVNGYYVPGYHFMSKRFLNDLIKNYPNETDKFKGRNEKCIKVELYNTGLGDGSRLEIFTDDQSDKLFKESIKRLELYLDDITKKFRLEDVPKLISPDFYGINFLIIYE